MKNLFTICIFVITVFTAKGQDLIPFEERGRIGFKDSAGEIVAPAYYEYPADFDDGLFCIKINDKYGFIDVTGRIAVPFKYDYATDFYRGRAIVQIDNTVRMIDLAGKEIKILKYEKMGWSKGDITNVGLNGKYGRIFIATGEEVFPPIYESMPRFYGDDFAARVQLNDKWGFIGRLGDIIIPIEYDEVGYSSGELTATKDGKKNYFDRTGKKLDK